MQGLNLIDLEDLLEDIKVYCEIERDTNTDFWIVSHARYYLFSLVNDCVEEDMASLLH